MPIRVLNVAEKPSVAKAVSNILSNGQSQRVNGRSPYNHIFKFNYMVEGKQCDMRMTSVSGHLCGLDFVGNWGDWSASDPGQLFDVPVVKTVNTSGRNNCNGEIAETLMAEAKRAQWLVLWLDCDREGENIAYEVIDQCRKVNPHLIIKRAHFSALIPADIHQACQTLTPPDPRLSEAVDTRQELDLRLGAVFTRLQTIRLRQKFPTAGKVISYGPCQFPTLFFVVDRYKSRESFVSEPFWKLELAYKPNDQTPTCRFNWKLGKLFDQTVAAAIYESCLENPVVKVIDVHGRSKSKWRPKPLATVEFQKRAIRFLRMTSAHAMSVAEKLYQQGILSYPRTETDMFKEGTDLRGLIQTQAGHPEWGEYAATLLQGQPAKFQWPANGGHDDNAHPPIHPTQCAPQLQGDEKKVYELVARHFLASCSRNAMGQETMVTVDVNDQLFTASGLMITERNYLEVYKYDRWSASTVPLFTVGQTFMPSELMVAEGSTVAPKLLNEADLIALMDKYQIGTDATMASHIENIKKKAFVKLEGGYFKPQLLGLALIDGYEAMNVRMADPNLRGKMEKDLNLIVEGKLSKQQAIERCVNKMKEIYTEVTAKLGLMEQKMAQHFNPIGAPGQGDVAMMPLSKCGDCKQYMTLMRTASGEGRYLRCDSVQCNDNVYNLPVRGNVPNYEALDFFCPYCSFQVVTAVNPENTNSRFNVCPRCFSNPPEIEEAASRLGQMNCKQCSHPECKLALKTDDRPLRPCMYCNNGMLLHKFPDGALIIQCADRRNCKGKIGLPFAISIKVTDRKCRTCTAKSGGDCMLVKVKFRRGVIPHMLDHLFDETRPMCITGCHSAFRETFPHVTPVSSVKKSGGAVIASSRNGSSARSSSRGGGYSARGGRGRGGGGGRGGSNSSSSSTKRKAPQQRGGRGRGRGAANKTRKTSGRGRQAPAPSNQSSYCHNCGMKGHSSPHCPKR